MHVHLFLAFHSFLSTCYGNFGSDLASAARFGAKPDDTEAAETLIMISGNVGKNQDDLRSTTVMKPINSIQSSQSSHEALPFENFRKPSSFKEKDLNPANKEILTPTEPSPRFSIGTQESRTPSLNKIQDSPTTTEDGSSSRSTIDSLSDLRGEFGTPEELKETRQYWQGIRTKSPKSPRKRPWGADFLAETNEAPATKIRKIVLPEGYAPLNTEKVLELFSNGASAKKELSPEELSKAKDYAQYFQKGTGGSDYFTSTAAQKQFISLGISAPVLEQRSTLDKFMKFIDPIKEKKKATEVAIKDFHRRARESAVDWQLLSGLENEAKVKFEGMLKALSESNPRWTNEQSLGRLNDIKLYIEKHINPDTITSESILKNTQKWENGGYIKFLEPFEALNKDSNLFLASSLRRSVKLDKDSLVKIQGFSKDLGDISSFARASGSRFLENTESLGKASMKTRNDRGILNLYQQYASESSGWLLRTRSSQDSLSEAVQARLKELKTLDHSGQIIR